MKIHNTRTRQVEQLKPTSETVRIYSCGPTVYDKIHIGNLSAFTYADLLRRSIKATGHRVRHVMNITDVDDKTINRSKELYPNKEPLAALNELTDANTASFISDMQRIGNEVADNLEFIRATKSIEGMRQLISELFDEGVAYIGDDGVYFSIETYRKSGKKYGQLSEITNSNTSNARIQNDEYDKDAVHDFALWKKAKPGEPSWSFELEGQNLSGRPGWHIECSVMSVQKLGQPFDIHTGGIDLIFPHHENEIAQSTATNGDIYANVFFHNEHLLVDGKKMSKSLKNFYTLDDILDQDYDPMAFRLLILQSHYRKQVHFSWENLTSAQNRLRGYERMADLKWQPVNTETNADMYNELFSAMVNQLSNDLNSPEALRILSEAQDSIETLLVSSSDAEQFQAFLDNIQNTLGLDVADRPDISSSQKTIIKERQEAREAKNWEKSDTLRDELQTQGIGIRDTKYGPVWFRT